MFSSWWFLWVLLHVSDAIASWIPLRIFLPPFILFSLVLNSIIYFADLIFHINAFLQNSSNLLLQAHIVNERLEQTMQYCSCVSRPYVTVVPQEASVLKDSCPGLCEKWLGMPAARPFPWEGENTKLGIPRWPKRLRFGHRPFLPPMWEMRLSSRPLCHRGDQGLSSQAHLCLPLQLHCRIQGSLNSIYTLIVEQLLFS